MLPLSKKILLVFIILNSLFIILGSPSPSLAQVMQPSMSSSTNPHQHRYPCRVISDCSNYASSWNFNECVCDSSEKNSSGACQGTNGEYLGHCTGNTCSSPSDCPGGSCVASPDDSSKKICQYTAESDLARAAPYFIRTPDDVAASAKDVNGFYDSDKFALQNISTFASALILATEGNDNSPTTEDTTNPQNTKNFNNMGATGILTGLVLNMTTKPVISSKEYLADLGHNLGITPVSPVYAQGIGFNSFLPVLPLWKTFRDIAYLAFVAIFIIVGLMVMFRKKIDPRTVVTIQDSLPKLIVALLLITFSYAIAGLVVDLAQFATRLMLNLFAGEWIARADTGNTAVSTADKVNLLLNTDIFHLVNPLRDTGDLSAGFKNIALSFEGQALATIAGLTVRVVFAIVGFFVMFKIFFALIGPYVSIILSVITAPIVLLAEALPGSKGPFAGWLKNLVANVAVFPVTFIMLTLAAIFKSGPTLCRAYSGLEIMKNMLFLGPADWATSCQTFGSNLWTAPAIGNWGPVSGQLISLGILFAIPKVDEIIKGALEIKPSAAGQIVGQEMKGGLARIPLLGNFLQK